MWTARALTCYLDGDGDLYSNWVSEIAVSCSVDYYEAYALEATTGDCNDSDALYNPATFWYEDADGDGRWYTNIVGSHFVASYISGDVGISYGSVMWDVDGDGDLDIYVVRNSQNFLRINNGSWDFTSYNISGDNLDSRAVVMWDVDGDGDLDIYVANYNQQNKLWINDWDGNFTSNDIGGDLWNSLSVTMWDVDGDNDLDIYVGNRNWQNKLWINDGSGNFTWWDISGDLLASYGVVMWDIDGDTDLDIYVSNNNQQNHLWINNGSWSFTGQDISGDVWASRSAVIGDVDGDNDLDIYVVNNAQQNKLWINNGSGSFTGQDVLGDTWASLSVAMWDMDNDNDLDLYVVNYNQQNKLWVNNGSWNFTASDIVLDTWNSQGVSIGDVNGDNYPDLHITKFNQQTILRLSTPTYSWAIQQCDDPGATRYLAGDLTDTEWDDDDSDPLINPGMGGDGDWDGDNWWVARKSSISEEDIVRSYDSEDANTNEEQQQTTSSDEENKESDNDSNNTTESTTPTPEDTCSDHLIDRMYQYGLTKYDNGQKFGGDDEIIREDAAKFVSKFGELIGLKKTYGFCEFIDTVGIDETLQPYILQACAIGLLKGAWDRFMPREKVTYAQGIVIAVRALYGFQEERLEPRYAEYINVAQQIGISTDVPFGNLDSEFVTREELGKWLCIATQMGNISHSE